MFIGASSGAVVEPSLTIGSSTNYNQNSAVFNATVNTTGNRNITLVEFQHSTNASFASGNSAWFTASTNSSITQGATDTACTYNATGLTAATDYYVRIRTTNASGIVTTSSIGGSFKTYVQYLRKQYTSSQTWTNAVPTSGTSGLALVIDEIVAIGGGGGAQSGGGAGGTVTTYTNINLSGIGTVTLVVGAGGGGALSSGSSSDGSQSYFGFFGASGGQRGNHDGNFSGGNGNGFSGGGSGGGASGGGGAGIGGAGANGTGVNGGNGGGSYFGIAGGGGGSRDLFSPGGTDGSPQGNGGANTGMGGGNSWFNGSVLGNGGSGILQLTFYAPVGAY